MRKTAAVLIIVLACCITADAAYALKCIWSERWSVKTLADKNAAKIDFRPIRTSVHKLVKHKPLLPPLPISPRQGIEFSTFEVTCRIKSYNTVVDGDINLILSDPDYPKETIIAEMPDPDCPDVIKSPYVKWFRRVREEFRLNCAKDGRIIADDKSHSVREGLYTITGVAFVDIPHFQEGTAPNYIELHPILSIKRANLLSK